MKKLNILLSLILTVILFSGNALAVEVGMEWQDGSNEITINYGDSVSFEANAGSIKMPLSVSLVLMNENILHVYEDFDNYYDYLYGNKYLVTKDHYKNAGDYVIHIEAVDGIGDTKINELILHVLEAEKDDKGEVIINNFPIVNDIIITENDGLFSFEIIASDVDGDEIKEYESRVVAKGVEYSAFCENNICVFNSRDPTNDGFEVIRFDDEAVVKARAYDGKNWGNWYEESLIIDNRDAVVEEAGRHAPVLDPISDREVFENSALIFGVTASDEDNDILLVDVNGLPEGASFENNVFNWKPDYNAVVHGGIIDGVLRFISFGILGSEPSSNLEVNFYVVDNRGNYDIEKVKIKVKDVNRLPILEVSNINVNEGELVKVIPVVSDVDNDKVKVTFSAPLNSNGEWQTGFESAGDYVITVTADDSYNGIVQKNINLNVNDVNRVPVIDSISGVREVFEGDLVELTVNAHDDDKDGLKYSTDSNLFSQSGDIFRWQTEIGNKGSYSANFIVEDGKNGRDSESVNIIVKEKINLAPTAVIVKPEKDLNIKVGNSVEFIGRGEDSDGNITEYKWTINGEKVSDKDRFTYVFEIESTHLVEFFVKDNRGKWSNPDNVSVKVEMEIIILNNAPVINNIDSAREVFAGDIVELIVNARDVDNDELIYSITGNLFSQNGNKFTWRTSDADVGRHVFAVSVSDGKLSDYETINVLVKEKPKVEINNPPILSSIGNKFVNENQKLEFAISAMDVDNDVLRFEVSNLPNGAVFNQDTKIFSWVPTFEQSGSYNVIFRVTDAKDAFDFENVQINVNNVNRMPSAIDASLIINEDTEQTIILKGSDSDNDDLRFVIISNPSNGGLLNFDSANGTVTYTPNKNFNGDDSFTFKVNDGISDSNVGRISIAIQPINDAPSVISSPVTSTIEGTPYRYDVDAFDADNDALIFSLASKPNGMSINSDTGLISWVPTFEQRGIHIVIVEVSDSALKAFQGFRINVVDFNRAPSAEDMSVVMNEDTSQAIMLRGLDVDNDRLTFEIVTNPANGRLSNFNSNGQVTYTPNRDFNGNDIFTFKVNDGISYSNIGRVSITVKPINDVPSANDDFIATNEDMPVLIDVLANDHDIEDNKPRIESVAVSPRKGSATIENGKIRYTPDRNIFGIDSFTYRAIDSSGATDTAVVNIRINAINSAPVIDRIDGVREVFRGELVELNVNAHDNDNDRIVYSITGNKFLQDGNRFTWRTSEADIGRHIFAVTASDGKLSDYETVSILVKETPRINNAPVVANITDQIVTEGGRFSEINLDNFVTDVDNTDGEIRWSISGNSRLNVNIGSDRIARVSYPAGFIGSETILFTARDPSSAIDSDSAVFTVKASPIIQPTKNRNPVLIVTRAGNAVSHVIINEGEGLVLSLDARDADNDNLKFEAVNLPIGSVFDENKKEFSWTPTNTQGRQNYVITFRVFDLENGKLKGGSDSKTVIVIVNDNLEPIAKPAGKKAVKKHVLNVKNIIVNNWETVKRGEAFAVEVVVDNKGNVKEENVKVTLSIPQLDYYERSSEFDLKKKKSENRGFLAVVPEDVEDETIYVIVTVSSNKDEVVEVIGFLVE